MCKGMSNRIQNELLDCMLDVIQGRLIKDMKNTEFMAAQAAERTDVSTHCQFVVVFRYIDEAQVFLFQTNQWRHDCRGHL